MRLTQRKKLFSPAAETGNKIRVILQVGMNQFEYHGSVELGATGAI
jgi:hypothetical protein